MYEDPYLIGQNKQLVEELNRTLQIERENKVIINSLDNEILSLKVRI